MLLSIIIPSTGRRRALLAAAIQSCLNQKFARPSEYEVLVVDNTPQGALLDFVAAFEEPRLRWVHAAMPGVSSARNAGVAAAQGRYIAFLDDDERAADGWAQALLDQADAGARAVFGAVEPAFEVAPGLHYETAVRLYRRSLNLPEGADATGFAAYLGTGNSLFDKAVCFKGATPFAEDLGMQGGEDTLFIRSLVERGIPLTWSARAVVKEHISADRLAPEGLGARLFRNGQIRSLACFRSKGVLAKLEGLGWMSVGVVQAIGYALASLALGRHKPERAQRLRFKAWGGVGKMLWQRRYWAMSYAPAPAAEADAEPAAMEPLVSIMVVNYRTREMTLECLRSIIRETKRTSFEIILVDNDSGDGIAAAVAQELPTVRIISLTENLGFARGNNVAAAVATGTYLLLLNPDTVVLDNAIDQLVDFARAKPAAGIWGGRTLYGDRTLNPKSCWRRMTLWNVFCRTLGLSSIFPSSPLFHSEAYGGWDRSTEREVDIVTGCFLLIGRQMWKELGGFDPKFFMYGEEADLCLRAVKLGARPAVTPNATIVHYGGASEQTQVEKEMRLLAARAELIQRHWSEPWRSVGLPLFAMLPLTRALALSSAAWVLRSAPHKARASTWWQIWQRRCRWQLGYQ